MSLAINHWQQFFQHLFSTILGFHGVLTPNTPLQGLHIRPESRFQSLIREFLDG